MPIDARLMIEVDGGQHHRSSSQEAERSRFRQEEGYRVLRFWNNELLSNIEGLRAKIAEALRRCHPHPTLTRPHQGGGNALTICEARVSGRVRGL
jgi:very-short-patch-repair endonuclease